MIRVLDAPLLPATGSASRRGVLLFFSLLVAACHSTASTSSRAPSADCGAAGEDAPWCTGPFPGPDPPVTAAARLALVAALTAACPPATAEDPTPGLSPGARSLDLQPHRRRRMLAPIGPEIDTLERLLAATPASSPDHVLILDRLAEAYFFLERASYEACRGARVPEVATRSALQVEEERARKVIDGLRRGHDGAERQCAALVRLYPDHVRRAPCAG